MSSHAAAGELEAFGEVWSQANLAGSPAGGPASLDAPAEELQAPPAFDEEVMALLDARNISAADADACGKLLNISKVTAPSTRPGRPICQRTRAVVMCLIQLSALHGKRWREAPAVMKLAPGPCQPCSCLSALGTLHAKHKAIADGAINLFLG